MLIAEKGEWTAYAKAATLNTEGNRNLQVIFNTAQAQAM